MAHEQLIGKRVRINENLYKRHIGKVGKVVGLDTRPIGFPDGEYLIISLEEKDSDDVQLGVARALRSAVEFLKDAERPNAQSDTQTEP